MRALLIVLVTCLPAIGFAQEGAEGSIPPDSGPGGAMTTARIETFIARLDPAFVSNDTHTIWQFKVETREMMVITDPNADRMRIMTPIAPAEALTPDLMVRMLQANHDTALDVRYSVARNVIWATFIHPLSPLDDKQLVSGLRQTYTAADTFGSTFSSGAMIFGGGDSQDLFEGLEDLLEQDESTTF